jgi:hypothetical protein
MYLEKNKPITTKVLVNTLIEILKKHIMKYTYHDIG